MYIHELSIGIADPKTDRSELYDQATWLLAALYKNGQIQEHDSAVYFAGNRLVLVLTSIEKSSLSKKHEGFYVKEVRKTLEKMCGSKFKTKLLGQEPPYDEEHLCFCVKPKSLYLRCSELNYGNPL